MQASYIKTVEGYIREGYARPVTDEELKSEGKFGIWYIPHHAVTHPKKPGKVRVVFDCSAKHQGMSFNDHTYTGPDIVNTTWSYDTISPRKGSNTWRCGNDVSSCTGVP